MKRILLVEDDAELRLLLAHVLFDGGYRVDAADSVAAACSLLDGSSYDLVLADGRLQDGTGMVVADRAVTTGTQVLIITGYAFELPREQLTRYEFLLKPVRPDELLQAVARTLASSTS